MTLESQAAAAVRWTSISAVSTTVLELLRLVVVARLLSPEDFGLMGMVMIVIGAAQSYTDLGISGAIIHRQDTTREQLSSLYWLNIFTGLIVFGLVWLCMPLIVLLFSEPRVLPLLRVVALVFLVAPIGKQFEILLQKRLSFDVLARIEIIASLSALVVAVFCGVSGFGVWTLVLAFLTNITLKTFFLVQIGLARFRPSLHFSQSDLRGFLGFGLFQMGERAANYLSQRLDQILIGSLLGARTLGLYTFAFNLTAQPISRINPIITKVAFPVFSKVQHEPEKLRKGYMKVLSYVTTINAPLLVGLAAVTPLAIPLIFGGKWNESIILIQILCFVSLLRSTCNPIGSLQLAKGRADLGFKWNVLLLACSVPAIYVGATLGQGIGVAIALLLLQACLAVPVYLYLVRPLIGECAQDYASAVLKPIAVALSMGLLIIALPAWDKGSPGVIELTTQVAVGAFVYLALSGVFNRRVLYEFQARLFSR